MVPTLVELYLGTQTTLPTYLKHLKSSYLPIYLLQDKKREPKARFIVFRKKLIEVAYSRVSSLCPLAPDPLIRR